MVSPKQLPGFNLRWVEGLFGNSLLFKCPSVATLSWLPDFQHMHMPEMFSETDRVARDTEYMQSVASVSRVVLLSDAVKKDLKLFAPQYVGKEHSA